MPYASPEKKTKHNREYQEANREKLRAYQREYMRKWRDNPEQMQKEREARRAYYARNKETEQARAREYMRAYYLKNKALFSERGKAKYSHAVQRMNEYMSTRCCEHCSIADVDVLEFHHPVPKGRENGKRVEPTIKSIMTHSWKKVLAEIAKCIVLCANCHRKEHARLRREQALDRGVDRV